MVLSRSGRRGGRAARLAVHQLEDRTVPASFLFDPDGAGSLAAQTVGSFDFAPGSALADNSLDLTVGSTFQLYYQAAVAGLRDAGGNPIAVSGLNTTFELTVVASVTEVVTGVGPSGAPETFSLAPVQAATSFIQVYFDSPPDASPLAGTGFNDGTLILTAFPDARVSNSAAFTVTTAAGSPVLAPYDQFGVDNYPGIQTVQGTGTTTIGGAVTSVDPAFFQTPALTAFALTAATALPFTQTDPSLSFTDGSAVPVVASIGLVNGSSAGLGTDFELQADADGTVLVSRINVVKQTNGTDNNTAPGVFVPVGSTVTFTYVVTNTGDTPLAGVTVVDDNGTLGVPADDFNPTFTGGDTNTDGFLDVGETWTFTATRIATAGQYTNTATASGIDTVFSTATTDTDSDNHFGAIPGVSLVKLTNGTDNNAAPGVFVPVGSTVTFTYVVTNTGNVPLSGVTVTDDNGTPGTPADDFAPAFAGGDTNTDGFLDVGETWTFTATRIATAGPYTNAATVIGTPPPGAGPVVTATDSDNHFGAAPAIDVVKMTNGTDNDIAPGVFVPVGSTVTFTYTVTNPGNVPLSGVTVTDDNGTPGTPADDFAPAFAGGDTNTDGFLDVGETWTFTAARIATAGQYTNTATATGTPPLGSGPAATDTNPDNHFGAITGIGVDKRTDGTDNPTAPGVFVTVGNTVTFTYTVTNTGNVALAGVSVTDDNGTPGDAADDFAASFSGGDTNGDGFLDPAETWTFTASRVATFGQYTNTATASGTPPAGAGPAVAATDTDNHFGVRPDIVVGADEGGGPVVRVFNADGSLRRSFFAFDAAFRGGVRVATGDVTGDFVADIVVGAGPGAAPHVKVFDGVTGAEVRSFFAFGAGLTGGVYVAAGDVDNDGRADVIVGAGPGGGPHVKAFSGRTGAEIRSFFAYASTYPGGVTVAAGDVDGDGYADVITGAGARLGPHVKVFSGRTQAELSSFFAFAPQVTTGVFVGAGDVDADGRADVIVGAGPGSGPHVKAFSGRTGAEIRSFFAFAPTFAGGVHVTGEDLDGDGYADILAGAASSGPHVKAFSGRTGAELLSFFAYDQFAGGVFVG